MTEKEKMLSGKLYDPFTDELIDLRTEAHRLCRKYNSLPENSKKREKIIKELFPKCKGLYLQGPINFDYGCFVEFGENCYANFNFTVIDTCKIIVGDNVFFGPNVTLATAIHPFVYDERNSFVRDDGNRMDIEYGKPITIGGNCWIASNVTICGGVTIGEGCVIGAGSVVTRSIPKNSFAVGNPCKVVREITEKDSVYLKEELK